MSTPVYIAGVGMTPFGKHLELSIKQLTRAAVEAALADAGCDKELLQGAFFANSTQGHMDGQHMIRGELALRDMGLQALPVVNVENACASASTAFHLAVNDVRAGARRHRAGGRRGEDVLHRQGAQFSAFDGAWDVHDTVAGRELLMQMGHGIEPPPGSMSSKPYSVFMDIYAAMARMHMSEYGTTQRQFAAVSAKNHAHSVHNPLAQYRKTYSVEQVLAAAPIAYPLTLPMCSPISRRRGGGHRLQRGRARPLGARAQRAVRVLASVLQTGSDRPAAAVDRHLVRLRAAKAYEQAGRRTRGMSTWPRCTTRRPSARSSRSENLGLCPAGEGGPTGRARRDLDRRAHSDQPLRRAGIQGPSDRRDRPRADPRTGDAAARRSRPAPG